VPAGAGAPDGLTVDAAGGVWLALWGGGAVHRYAPDGSLDRVVRLPVSHPTSCAFGGDDLGDLYITTAAIALSPAERARQLQAGGLFRCRPGVAGRPAPLFAG
jgi:sugar lactone lactonase YvrE